VVLIEDNEDAAVSMRVLFEAHGHRVALAHTGAAGVQAVQQTRPDLVICDLGLPDMDGYAVAEELRRDPATASVPMIALTGYGHDEAQHRTREAGFDLHLTKPVDFGQLEAYLAALPPRGVAANGESA
jgi:CheY-like chemotaxis protein